MSILRPLVPILIIFLLSVAVYIQWRNSRELKQEIQDLKGSLVLIQRSQEVSTEKLQELRTLQENIRRNNASLSKQLKELKNVNETVRDYLNSPVPSELNRLYGRESLPSEAK